MGNTTKKTYHPRIQQNMVTYTNRQSSNEVTIKWLVAKVYYIIDPWSKQQPLQLQRHHFREGVAIRCLWPAWITLSHWGGHRVVSFSFRMLGSKIHQPLWFKMWVASAIGSIRMMRTSVKLPNPFVSGYLQQPNVLFDLLHPHPCSKPA